MTVTEEKLKQVPEKEGTSLRNIRLAKTSLGYTEGFGSVMRVERLLGFLREVLIMNL